MSTDFSTYIPGDLPPAYDKVLKENSKLVDQVFQIDLLGKGPKFMETLLHFLDVYIEVFEYSISQTLPNETCAVFEGGSEATRQCVTKFRQSVRKQFRGVQYFPCDLFKELLEKAVTDSLHYFGTITSPISKAKEEKELRNVLNSEQSWLEEINSFRRNQDLELIKIETIESLKKTAMSNFSYLYNSGNEMKYCDENQLNRELQELLMLGKQQYREQIPFRNLETDVGISKLCSEFEVCLKVLTQDVLQRNLNRKAIVEACMDALVQNCVEKYSTDMENYLRSAQTPLKLEETYCKHKSLVQEHFPKFTNTINGMEAEVGSQECRVQNWNKYGDKTHQVFQKLLEAKNENAKTVIKSCEKDTTEEVQMCLEKVTKILTKHGLENFADEFQIHVQSGLKTIFARVNESNNLNGAALVESTKPIPVQSQQPKTFTDISEQCKLAYTEKLVELIRGSKNSGWGQMSNQILDLCHNKAKQYILQKVEEERDKLTQVPEILQRIFHFSDYFILQAKGNLKVFMEKVGQYEGTPVPFKAKTGYDTEVKHRLTSTQRTRFQCLTLMNEYENKSLEELQFEDRTKQRAVPLHLLVMTNPVPDLATLFAKNLQFGENPLSTQ